MPSIVNDNFQSTNTVNLFSPSFDSSQDIEEAILQTEKSFCKLQQLTNKLDTISESFQQTLESLEILHEKTKETYMTALNQRMRVIDEQAAALKAFALARFTSRIKAFWRPRIGSLFHHPERPLLIKKHYNNKIPLLKTPTISIVTPSYNQENFIEKTILSVIDQDYPSLEYIIQDGNSTDKSVDIIKRYGNRLKHWSSNPDNGQSHAINLGFQHATGEIMAYLNSDDILLPGTLNYVANYFNEHPDVDVLYGHRILINEKNREVGRWVLPPHSSRVLKWADYIPQETLFWRRRIWDKTGAKIDESFQFAMDWDLLLRFQEAGAKFVRVPRFLGAFRVHSKQKTSAEIMNSGLEEMDRLRTRCHGREIGYLEVKRKTMLYIIKHVFYHKLYKAGILRY